MLDLISIEKKNGTTHLWKEKPKPQSSSDVNREAAHSEFDSSNSFLMSSEYFQDQYLKQKLEINNLNPKPQIIKHVNSNDLNFDNTMQDFNLKTMTNQNLILLNNQQFNLKHNNNNIKLNNELQTSNMQASIANANR